MENTTVHVIIIKYTDMAFSLGVPWVNELIKVPIHLKVTLTLKEASAYSNIGIHKLDK